MTTLIIGGTGFIGRRLIPLLARRGEEAVCVDINPQTANYSELAKVRVLRGDISQFDHLQQAFRTARRHPTICGWPIHISFPPSVRSAPWSPG